MGQESQSESKESGDALLQRLHEKAKAREKQRKEKKQLKAARPILKRPKLQKTEDHNGEVQFKKDKRHQSSSTNQSDKSESKKHRHDDASAGDLQLCTEEKKKCKKHKQQREEPSDKISERTQSNHSERTIEETDEYDQSSPKVEKEEKKR